MKGNPRIVKHRASECVWSLFLDVGWGRYMASPKKGGMMWHAFGLPFDAARRRRRVASTKAYTHIYILYDVVRDYVNPIPGASMSSDRM